MTRAGVLQEVRQMRFEELYERRQRRTLTMAEAAEILGLPNGAHENIYQGEVALTYWLTESLQGYGGVQRSSRKESFEPSSIKNMPRLNPAQLLLLLPRRSRSYHALQRLPAHRPR